MITIKNVCLDCPDRFPGCHSTCEKYQEARAELDAKIDKIRDQKRRERGFDDYRIESIRRAKKLKKDVR